MEKDCKSNTNRKCHLMIFEHKKTILPKWIDYNGHMQDAYYGLVFSQAVDALQDEVGFDQFYRQKTGCTIYLVEEHKFFLKEVKEGAKVNVKIRVLDVSEKVFHIYAVMTSEGHDVAISEMVQMHVSQNPTPNGVAIPLEIKNRLKIYLVDKEHQVALKHRARAMSA